MFMRDKADDASRRRRGEMNARLKLEEQLQIVQEAELRRREEQEVMAKKGATLATSRGRGKIESTGL